MNDLKQRVPIDLHEQMITHVAPIPAGGDDPETMALVHGIKFAREEAERLVELQRVTRIDPALNRDSAALRVRTFALRGAERVAAKLDAARTLAATALDTYDRATSSPPAPRDNVALGLEAEIRVSMKGMPASDRKKVIADAFAAKDERVLGALLRGPAFLSGLSPAEHDAQRRRYQREFHAAASVAADRHRKALEAFDRAGNSFMRLTRAMTDDPLALRAETASADREAAEAAIKGEEE
jgi:hypothetical protein